MLGPDARRHAESVDYVQGVFAKVLERLESAPFEDEDHVLRWMTAVARNDIRDHAGKRRVRAFESLSESVDAHALADSRTPSPVSQAERDDRATRLIECLERLSDDERAVIELRTFDGETFAAIGARLGWSDDRARLTHLRAMARLGQWFGA
jgi:RNA polymerase sigma factor (sigma-70 family)